MVSRFDAIAWVDHAPAVGIEVVMPKTFRPSKRHNATAQTASFVAQTAASALESRDEEPLVKMEQALNGFFAEARSECGNWSPEERRQRAASCVSEAMGHVDTYLGISEQIKRRASTANEAPSRQLVKAIADSIRFG
jgi:hypothetical protein